MTAEPRPTGLLDTCTGILLPRISDAGLLPGVPLISTASPAELALGPLAATTGVERARRQAQRQQA